MAPRNSRKAPHGFLLPYGLQSSSRNLQALFLLYYVGHVFWVGSALLQLLYANIEQYFINLAV